MGTQWRFFVGTTISRARLQLERLLATGDFFEAADLLAELDCDAIPEKWAPSII